jgi:RimJ/RimL family protein N-acetyltransferase
MPTSISAGEVELQRLEVAHVDAIVAAMRASLPDLRPWFPWARSTPSRSLQADRARLAQEAFEAGRDFEFSIFESVSGELVGGFRVNPLAGQNMAELGYWIRSDRHRRGYATCLVRAATNAVFEHLPEIDQIQVRMDRANGPSAGVARSAGLTLSDEVDRPIVAPGHTGRALVWIANRPPRVTTKNAR